MTTMDLTTATHPATVTRTMGLDPIAVSTLTHLVPMAARAKVKVLDLTATTAPMVTTDPTAPMLRGAAKWVAMAGGWGRVIRNEHSANNALTSIFCHLIFEKTWLMKAKAGLFT